MKHNQDNRSGHAARRRIVLGGLGGIAAALAAPLSGLSGCGGGAELFVPFISFTFDGTTQGATVSFFLSVAGNLSCVESGRFEFSRVTVTVGANSNQFDVSGTFNGRDMDLAIANPPALLAAAYKGRFISDATLTLTPVGGGTAFNVTRTGDRPASCPAGG